MNCKPEVTDTPSLLNNGIYLKCKLIIDMQNVFNRPN